MRGLFACMWLVGIVTTAVPAKGQDGPSPGGGASATVPPRNASAWAGLRSDDPADIQRAIRAIGRDRSRRGIQALHERIADGLPPRLLDEALDVLAAMGRGPASRVFLSLTRHRRATVRAQVAAGLVATRAPNAARELVRLLDDPSPAVRAAAARALGETGARSVMRELLEAARRGIPEAATVVGLQARPHQVAQILRGLEEGSLDALTPALRTMVGRQDLPEQTRRQVVERLNDLGTPAAYRVLARVIAQLDEADPVRVHAAGLVEAQATQGGEAPGAGGEGGEP